MNALKTVIVSAILWLAFPAMCAVASFIVYGGGWLAYRLVTLSGLHIVPAAFIVLMVVFTYEIVIALAGRLSGVWQWLTKPTSLPTLSNWLKSNLSGYTTESGH